MELFKEPWTAILDPSTSVARRTGGVLIVLLIGLTLRLSRLEAPIFHDEVYSTRLYLAPTQMQGERSPATDPTAQPRQWGNDWKRQLTIHPPLLLAFYYCWDQIAGDSEIPLRIPALIAGLLSLVLIHRAASSLLPSGLSLAAMLALSLSPAHVVYSTQAVYAVFECTAALGWVVALLKYLEAKTPASVRVLCLTLACASMLFYHAALLSAATLAIVLGDNGPGKRGICLTAVVCALPAVGAFFAGTTLGYYAIFPHWKTVEPSTVAQWLATLYHSYLHYYNPASSSLTAVGSILALLYLTGWGTSVRKALHDRSVRWRAVLFSMPIGSFVLYAAIALVLPKFGHLRNHFYLLPLFLLGALQGLSVIVGTHRRVAVIVVGILGVSSIALWRNEAAGKERWLEEVRALCLSNGCDPATDTRQAPRSLKFLKLYYNEARSDERGAAQDVPRVHSLPAPAERDRYEPEHVIAESGWR